jgi:DNA-binding transcriptional MerR regulator
MEPKVFNLEDLANAVGMTPRTIRSYIQQGLLRGPDAMGRNAHYSAYHFKRLEVIKTLKNDYGMGMREIRRLVTMAGPDEDLRIESLMDDLTKPDFRPRSTHESSAPAVGSALDFIRNRQALSRPSEETAEGVHKMSIMPSLMPKSASSGLPMSSANLPMSSAKLGRERPSSRLEELLEKFKNLSTGNPKRKTRGEDWIRLQITPDIEFHIRGQLSPQQLACFEQLADIMRHTLLGEDGDE